MSEQKIDEFMVIVRKKDPSCCFVIMSRRGSLSLLVLLASYFVLSPPLSAQDDTAGDQSLPPPRMRYMGRLIAPTMHYTGARWLIRESRQREEDCKTLLSQLGLQPGMTVCDMGTGNGFYAIRMARMVGRDGRILAVDIQPEMLELLKTRANKARITNIEPILGTVSDPKLPDGKVNLILCVDVYHEFSNPEKMLAAMRRCLAPDGRIALAEFREEDPQVPILPEHKMSKAQILREWNHNGFELVREFDELPWQHLMFFRRDDAP